MGERCTGSIPSGEWLNSRQFVLSVPSSSSAVGVRVEGDRDVDLYLRYQYAVSTSSQGVPDGDVSSASSSHQETIILTGSTIPNLRAGSWAVGVVNYDPEGPAHFSIYAVSSTAAPPQTILTAARSGTSYSLTLPQSQGAPVMANDQLTIPVGSGAKGIRVEVLSTAVDASVYLRRNRAVTVDNGSVTCDHSFLVSQATTFEVTTSQVNPLQSGTWYIGFSNASTKSGKMTFRITVY